MTHTYNITGMTCNGCRSHVEKTLNAVEGVSNATVDLEKAEATIAMDTHIALETFQKALKDDGGRYEIHLPGQIIITMLKQRKKQQHQKGRAQALFTVLCIAREIKPMRRQVTVLSAEWIS